MFRTMWKLIRNTLIFIGVLLSFITLMEVLRAYQTLRDVHPWLGYGFALIVIGGLIWIIAYYWIAIGSQPRVLTPPKIVDFETASPRQIRRYALYLCRYLKRLSINPNLEETQRQSALAARSRLSERLAQSPDRETLLTAVHEVEQNAVRPLLTSIDRKASKHVRDCMRDVMIAVTLSPYRSVDLAIVVYRNIRMVVDLIRMYNARPALKEQLLIFYDIFSIVATVNYIHLGRNLIQSLGSKVPGVGRFLDEIAQGIGAGFMTTITGHAAMQRCRAFAGWNPKKERDNLLAHIGDFYTDVRDIFFKDVWGTVIQGSGQVLDSAREAVSAAIDETGEALNRMVRVPVVLAAEAGNTGTRLVKNTVRSVTSMLTQPFQRKQKAPSDDR